MVPIFEQGNGKGIGHSRAEFTRRFEDLCSKHVREHRARAFAFIFYDFKDTALRRILKDEGVFTKLDRLSGTALSVFYLHSGQRNAVNQFNGTFLEKLNVTGNFCLLCIVFFRVHKEQICDIVVAQLEGTDIIGGFHELYVYIERYINEELAPQSNAQESSKCVEWLKSNAKFLSQEAFRAWLKIALQGLM